MNIGVGQVAAPVSEMLNVLLEQMVQGVIIMNIQSNEVQINPEAWALIGAGCSESCDMTISCEMFYHLCETSGKFWPEMSALDVKSYCETTMKKCRTNTASAPMVADKMLGSTLCRIQTIVRPGTGLMWILTDISNSQATQNFPNSQSAGADLVKRSLEKIKVPLNGVMGMASLLQRTELSDSQIAFADGILDAGSALSSIVRNIADYSALEFGRVTLNPEVFNLASVVDQTLASYHQAAKDKNIFLRIAPPDGSPEQVVGDSKNIARILNILVGNAIRHTEFGGVTIGQKITRGGDPQNPTSVISVSISDTGIGLRPPELKAVSTQLNSETYQRCSNVNGVGTKLAVVACLVRLMGGHIKIQSEELFGTLVSIEIQLPVAK